MIDDIGAYVVALIAGVFLPLHFMECVIEWSAKTEFPDNLKKFLGLNEPEKPKESLSSGDKIGMFERFFVITVLSAGVPEGATLILAYLGLKVAAKWDAWKNIIQVPGPSDKPDAEYPELAKAENRKKVGGYIMTRFVVGAVLNVTIGVLAWKVGEMLKQAIS